MPMPCWWVAKERDTFFLLLQAPGKGMGWEKRSKGTWWIITDLTRRKIRWLSSTAPGTSASSSEELMHESNFPGVLERERAPVRQTAQANGAHREDPRATGKHFL